jgi:hypothetical protein
MNGNARESERLWIADCGLEIKNKSLLHCSWIILIQAVLGASLSMFSIVKDVADCFLESYLNLPSQPSAPPTGL